MNKITLLKNVITQLKEQLSVAEQAQKSAADTATHSETLAKSKYDTFALEASYLAQGQQQRIAETQLQLQQLKKVLCNVENANIAESVEIGSLVSLYNAQKNLSKSFLILPCCGGLSCQDGATTVQVISPEAPIAKTLMHTIEGDKILFQNQLWRIDQIH